MLKKRRSIAVLISVLFISILGFVVYHSLYINLFGFQIKKSQLHNAVIYTNEHTYYVDAPQLVERIYTETASLHRTQRISSNFPEYKVYSRMSKLLIQTQDHTTYGGSIWADGHYIDANGSYWNLTPKLLELLKSSIQDNRTTKLF